MTPHPASIWSESLQQQTRDAIAQLPMTADGRLHFKHATVSGAYATYDDLCVDRLVLHAKKGSEAYRFGDVEALLQAGWAID